MRVYLSLLFVLIFISSPALAVVSFRSGNGLVYQNRTNTTLSAPTGLQNNDLILILFFAGLYGSQAPAPTPPAGFTAVSGFPQTIMAANFYVTSYAWYKIANSEPANYTITHSAYTTQAYVSAYSGVNSANPISPAPTIQTGSGSTSTATGVTTPTDGSLVVFWSQDWGDHKISLNAPTGTTPTFTKRFGETEDILMLATGTMATAGATGNKSITNNSEPSNPWQASLIVLQGGCVSLTSADSYRIPYSTSNCYWVTGPNAVCKQITNASSNNLDILVPAKTTGEWTSFYTNPPPAVSVTACP